MKNSLPIHPYCQVFPEMTSDEYKVFVDDLRTTRRLLNPIWTYDRQIVDGKHRDAGCLEAGLEPEFQEWEPSSDDPNKELMDFVVSQNLSRRHLNPSQIAIIAAEVATIRRNGISQESPDVSQEEAAERFGVSRGNVQRATTVLEEGSKQLQNAVREGDVRVGDAAQIIQIPKKQQDSAVRKVKSGETSSVTQAVYEEALLLIAQVNSKAASDIESGKWKMSKRRVIEIGNSDDIGRELRNERMGKPIQDNGDSPKKSGVDPSAVDREIQVLIGKLTRVFDLRAKQLGGQGPNHKACISAMKSVLDAWTEWRKAKDSK